MKTKFLIAILFAVAFAAIFIKQQFDYPPAWHQIQLGMSRKEVCRLLGEPPQSLGEEGAFWCQHKLTQRQELNVKFEDNKVSEIEITEYLGTRKNHFEFHPAN